jgi:CelD/BcsL family acetyltransferase involved in cellulose biosynthesis
MKNNHHKINIHYTFDEISDTWEEFDKNSYGYVFQSFNWVSHWQKTIGDNTGYKPCIVEVKDQNDKLLMLLPLSIQYKFGIKILTFAGGDYSCGLFCKEFYNYFDKNSFSNIIERIIKKINNIDLVYFTSQPDNIGSLKNPIVNFLSVYQYHAKSHQIILDNNWEKYEQTIKKKIIKDTERQKKRLQQKGKFIFSIAENINDINYYTNTMIEQKSYQYMLTGVENQFINSYNQDFYNNLFFDNSKLISTHVSALKINSSIIATHWGILDRKNSTLFYLMPAHEHRDWAKYSPGRLLMIQLLKWCVENKITIFDMTGGNEKYKLIWGNNQLNLFNYLKPITLLGFIISVIIKIRYFIKSKSVE